MVFGTMAEPAARQGLDVAMARATMFNGTDAAFFGVSVDPADRLERGLADVAPGIRFFWDFDCAVSRLYGVADDTHLKPTIFLIDPAFRVAMTAPIEATAAVLDRLAEELAQAPALAQSQFAPVLTLPRIVEPEMCAELIAYFRAGSPRPSGFAAEVAGQTVEQLDPRLKRRSDVTIARDDLVAGLRMRLEQRLFPMVRRAFGWAPAHIERYLVCRYDAEDQGFFFPHRDDVTAGTAHRKFAVTINLNAEDYDGGDLRFPEFGARSYRPPTGGATVFCCSLLHEAMPVTKGERFAFVPFLYDGEGARLRRANLARVGTHREGNRHMRRAGSR
jgi:hypothetical protein